MSTEANAQIISVIGGCRRAGRWLVPAKTKVMTFFGRATIDLRQAQTTADELAFDCMSAFASITFIVPEGAEIRPSGMAILASARSEVPVEVGGSHLPKIAIDAVTLFGRFRIVTGEALEADEHAAEQTAARVGSDLADTAPVEAFRPPVEPFRPPVEPHRPQVEDPASQRRSDIADERSPIHDVTVPDSPAAVSLDDRPEPLPEPEPEVTSIDADDESPAEAAESGVDQTGSGAAEEAEESSEGDVEPAAEAVEQAEDAPAEEVPA
ncbi:MAG: hypothetical protein AAF480_08075 [Actinomycetota bacterium]